MTRTRVGHSRQRLPCGVCGSRWWLYPKERGEWNVSSNLFAQVDAIGGLLAGSGVTGVKHIGTGQYEVTFSTDVCGYAYVATTVNAGPQTDQVFTAGGHLSSDGVYVETKNQGGGLTDSYRRGDAAASS